MSHELDMIGGKASMAYSAEHGTPWHPLGTPVAGLGTVDEMLQAAGLDWVVQKDPLRIPDPTHARRTIDVIDLDGNPHTVPDPSDPQRYLDTPNAFTWRENPDTGHGDFFGVVGADYTVIQARTMLEIGMKVAGFDPDAKAIDTLGAIRNGAQVFCTIPLPDWTIDPSGIADKIARQYSLMTDHTGRSAFKLLRSDTRVVCANTYRFAQDRAKWECSIKHTASAAEIPVAWVKSKLGFFMDSDEQFVAMMYDLLGQNGSWADVTTIADQIWTPDPDAKPRAVANRSKRMDRLSEIWRVEKDRAGNTGYAVYQTVQGYLQHEQGHTKGSARHERSVAGLQGATFARECAKLTGRVKALA